MPGQDEKLLRALRELEKAINENTRIMVTLNQNLVAMDRMHRDEKEAEKKASGS